MRLIEWLTPSFSFDIFIGMYSTYFCLLTHLGVNNTQATDELNKINSLSLGTNCCIRRNAATLNSAHQAKKQCKFDSGWLEGQYIGLHSFF